MRRRKKKRKKRRRKKNIEEQKAEARWQQMRGKQRADESNSQMEVRLQL